MQIFIFAILIFSFKSFSQIDQTDEVNALKKQVKELTEIVNENSEILKHQIKDQHSDQSSRGYFEIKFGRAFINPKEIQDNNDELFNDLNSASWEEFEYANVLDFEIGKTIYGSEDVRHDFGVGYQQLRSKQLQAHYTPTGGGQDIRIIETLTFQTVYARYSPLFSADSKNRLFIGPGLTIGYSPSSELLVQVEQGDEGAQVTGKGTSFLFELFGKFKYELARYFSVVGTAGYRHQEAEDLRLTAAELISIRTRTDADVSGAFATVGIAISM